MGVLTGIDETKKQLSTAQTAFVGRLVSAKVIRSTRSIPPRNDYIIEFEENIKSLKGSVPTTTQFDYSQMGKGEKSLYLLVQRKTHQNRKNLNQVISM
jgi:hypothetical protein